MATTKSQLIQVTLPDLGESVTEATVLEWLKQVGDPVRLDEEIVEVTSDKADLRIPSPADGVLARIVAQPGDTLAIGELLAELAPPGQEVEATPAPPAADEGTAPAAEPAAAATEAREPEPAAVAPPPSDGLVQVTLPDLGESVTEATVLEWLKQVGDPVARDEEIVEVTSDKADLRIPSPAEGVLARIVAQPGDTLGIGELLAELGPPNGATAATAPAAPEAATLAPAAETPTTTASEPPTPHPGAAQGGGLASPLARRLAAEQGVDLTSVRGSGPRGRIGRTDVESALSGNGGAAAAPEAPPAAAEEELVPLRGPAAALAGYMNESRTVPTATTVRTLNVATLDARRAGLNTALADAGVGLKLSYTHLIAWAIVRAIQAFPVMTTGYTEVDGKPHRIARGTVNLGLAVDVERRDGSRSLLVPVVRSAEALGFRGFVEAYDDLVKRTRGGDIKLDQLRGASVTLTNPGGFGTVASVPRLMAGQGTIVATGAIAVPAGFERADTAALGVDKVMTVTSTYDHRVIQGAESGAFLRHIDLLLRGEEGFYEEVAESLGVQLPELRAPVAPPSAAKPAPPVAPAAPPPPAQVAAEPDREVLRAVATSVALVKALRINGHLAAQLDPLGFPPPGDPGLEPETLALTPALMRQVPSDLLRLYVPGSTFAEAFPRLRETYCGTIAYQVEHISSHEQRLWLRRAIEGGAAKERLPEEERIRLLERLVALDHFERFLQRAYVGQKTFSIEGVDALVPMLDLTIELCSEAGAGEIVIGMAHRGRLNVITNVIGRPVESILAEFEGQPDADPDAEEEALETAGDVKYHLGAEGTYVTTAGRPIAVTLAANPSHLEQVNAVVEGGTRARQTVRKSREALVDPNRAVAVLVHGDAAFPGQGAVAETLNLSGLAGYSTGGTVHIIANNQIGFTTDPQDGRSTYYASDLAKGFDIPIIHVNADDVEACLEAVRLAVAFRNKFHRDVLIDLIGYRRHGHNEADEPAYTQPVMAMTIKEHPRAYEIYAQKLIGEAVVSSERVAQMEAEVNGRLAEARSSLTRLIEQTTTEDGADGGSEPQGHASPPQILHSDMRTAVSAEVLRSLNEELLTVPEGFTIHPKLRPQLERRRAAMGEDGGILWAHAEALAFASLLSDGVPIRLTGQDTQRGTFSQRHLELHDAGTDQSWMPYTGRTYVPMAHLSKATASFELYNSPLSESAAVGFEYGYSTLAPDALVLWEAQYGDFANGAQIIIDQFISSGRAKWGERSRLALLLPHGYEGSGPEHSSARIERFLQLSAEDNLRIAYPSTAAQYFHLLRRQGLLDEFRPLVVFTPKSLLRSREAASHIEDLAQGRFEPVLDDPAVADRHERVTRILFCTGKIAHELATAPARADAGDLAIVRIELLFPFPEMAAREVIARYPNLRQATWVQEEPRNMGAWDAMYRNIPRLLPEGATFEYLGRSPRSSPAEGYPQAHRAEQQRLLEQAFARDRGDG